MAALTRKTRNIRLIIAYDGTGYSGWQRQKNGTTIQGEIEHFLHHITREPVVLHGAGRTDAGVHADGMCAHFISHTRINCADLQSGLNSLLPGSIRIVSVEDTDLHFHSRFHAKGKHYQYSLYLGKVHPPRLRLYSLHIPFTINLQIIRDCLQLIEGTHDFSSFENSGSRDKSVRGGKGAVRTIYLARLAEKSATELNFDFKGDGFLRQMIRNMVGTLLDAGRGRITVAEFSTALQAKDRTKGGPTAPAHGLCLKRVFY